MSFIDKLRHFIGRWQIIASLNANKLINKNPTMCFTNSTNKVFQLYKKKGKKKRM